MARSSHAMLAPVPPRSPKDTYITVYGRKPVLEALSDPSLTVDKIITADNVRGGGTLTAILDAARRRGVPGPGAARGHRRRGLRAAAGGRYPRARAGRRGDHVAAARPAAGARRARARQRDRGALRRGARRAGRHRVHPDARRRRVAER